MSTPPFAVPPLSCNRTVTVAVPIAFASGVNVSVPVVEIDGCTENSALLLLVTRKVSVCADSFGGPALMLVAQLMVWAPVFTSSDTAGPAVNEGASFTESTLIVRVTGALVSTPPLRPPPLSCS